MDACTPVEVRRIKDGMFRTFYGHGQPSEPLWGPLWRQLQGLLEAHMGGPIAPRWFEAENLDDDQLRASRLWSELTRALRPLQQQRFGAAVVGQLRKLLEHRMPDAARQDLHHYHEQLKESVGIPPLGEDVRFCAPRGSRNCRKASRHTGSCAARCPRSGSWRSTISSAAVADSRA
jgi:hypothetical protein